MQLPVITRKKFSELASVKGQNCVSVYIPTQRRGNNEESKIRFKNRMQKIQKQLLESGMTEKHVNNYLAPLYGLLADSNLWRHLREGLVVLLSSDKFFYSTLSLSFREYSTILDSFYLLPLIPHFNGDGKFYILALSLKRVRLFECTRDSINRVDISGIVPQKLEETVGYDYQQKSIRLRSVPANNGQGMFHGQGEGKEDRKEEIIKHLRKIDRGLSKILNNQVAPLIVASVDNIHAYYRQVNSYKNLYDENISGNPDGEDMAALHQKGWKMLMPIFRQRRKASKEEYFHSLSRKKASAKIDEIAVAATNGEIKTLFVKKDFLWDGIMSSYQKQLTVDNKPHIPELIDTCAKSTFLKGGKVYLMEPEELPEDKSILNAIFRY